MNHWYPVEEELVLASRSPRRTRILTMARVPHTVQPSGVEETPVEGTPGEIVTHWASAKAAAVARHYSHRPVLGADTMVFRDGVLLGKPEDGKDAIRMLESLSGRWHTVFGGVSLLWKSRGISFSFFEATRVRFRKLTGEEIEAYVSSGEPMDKAGAYGIQGLGCVLVDTVEGSYFNVMGLPVSQFLARFRASL